LFYLSAEIKADSLGVELINYRAERRIREFVVLEKIIDSF
jgi:hypothetical protein